ncbi:MAG: Clp protease N-terminal domain-containing protein, partial [Candidatus Saccharibacteria bacterium]
MDINKLTEKSKEALHDAEARAVQLSHQEIDVEHLFLALLEQGEGLIPRIFERLGTPPARLISQLEESLSKRPKVTGRAVEQGKVYVTG